MAQEVTVNPRYVEFARLNGRTPDEQLEADAFDYAEPALGRGACMVDFMLFISRRWDEFAKAHTDLPLEGGARTRNGATLAKGPTVQELFDLWLPMRVDELLADAAKLQVDCRG